MNMGHYCFAHDRCGAAIKIFVERIFTTRDQNPAPAAASQPFSINLELSCDASLSKWVVEEITPTQGHAHCVEEINSPYMKALIAVMSLQEFLCYKKAHEIIAREISHFPLWDIECEKVIDFMLSKAREAVISMPPNHNVLNLRFHTIVVRELYFDLVNWVTQHSMEVDEGHMVPTKDSLIELLERKKLVMIDPETCSICLEEPPSGCEAVCMPCSHFFHGDCIKKWLRTSHYCTICRFEMPTT